MDSRRRKSEISCGARPGFVGFLDRIWEMCMGRPWSVARTRREHKEWWPVNLMGAVWVDIA